VDGTILPCWAFFRDSVYLSFICPFPGLGWFKLHFPVPSMNRLNQTEPSTFSILLCWAFFRDSVFLYFNINLWICKFRCNNSKRDCFSLLKLFSVFELAPQAHVCTEDVLLLQADKAEDTDFGSLLDGRRALTTNGL
jgi:hypothetical protein